MSAVIEKEKIAESGVSGVTVNFNIGGLPRNVLGVAMVTAWRTPALEAVRANLSASAAQYADKLKAIAQSIRQPYKEAAAETNIGAYFRAAYGANIHPGKTKHQG